MISHPVPQGMSKYWQQKSVGTVSSLVPQLKGLRIAHHHRTSNAEAHANMYNISSPICLYDTWPTDTYISTGIYRCFIPDDDL